MSLLSREKVAISLTSAILFWTWLQAIFIVTSSFSRYSLLTFPPLHLLTTVPPFSTPLLVFLFNYNCSKTVPFKLFSMFENEREKREKKRDFFPTIYLVSKIRVRVYVRRQNEKRNKINGNEVEIFSLILAFLENSHLNIQRIKLYIAICISATGRINPLVSRQILQMLQIYIPAIFVFFRNFELSNEVEADSDLHSWPGDWNESPN